MVGDSALQTDRPHSDHGANALPPRSFEAEFSGRVAAVPALASAKPARVQSGRKRSPEPPKKSCMPASFFDDRRAFYSRFSYHPVFSQNVKQEAGILSRRCLLLHQVAQTGPAVASHGLFLFQDFFSSCRKQDGTTTTTDGRAPCLRANLEELPDWASLPSMTKPPSSLDKSRNPAL